VKLRYLEPNPLGSYDAMLNSLLLLTMLFLNLARVLDPHPSSLPVKDEYHLHKELGLHLCWLGEGIGTSRNFTAAQTEA
jgi:hypothetical protein